MTRKFVTRCSKCGELLPVAVEVDDLVLALSKDPAHFLQAEQAAAREVAERGDFCPNKDVEGH